MLSNLIYFLESLHCVRSLISIIVFAVGIVLILIWKFKIKKTALLVCSVILMIIPCIVIVHGCYSAYLRPAHMEVALTQQELADFSEYVLEDDRFLDTKSFLRNNEKWFYQEEKGKEEQIDGKTLYSDDIQQGVLYQPNSSIYYYLSEYEDAETAEKVFMQSFLPDVNNAISMENKVYIVDADYTACASQEFDGTFFDWHQGEHNFTTLTVAILHENYIIWIREGTERHTPKLYSLIKEEKLFDSDYKLKTWVKA